MSPLEPLAVTQGISLRSRLQPKGQWATHQSACICSPLVSPEDLKSDGAVRIQYQKVQFQPLYAWGQKERVWSQPLQCAPGNRSLYKDNLSWDMALLPQEDHPTAGITLSFDRHEIYEAACILSICAFNAEAQNMYMHGVQDCKFQLSSFSEITFYAQRS